MSNTDYRHPFFVARLLRQTFRYLPTRFLHSFYDIRTTFGTIAQVSDIGWLTEDYVIEVASFVQGKVRAHITRVATYGQLDLIYAIAARKI
jgi:hypothetical protein